MINRSFYKFNIRATENSRTIHVNIKIARSYIFYLIWTFFIPLALGGSSLTLFGYCF